MQSNAFLVFGRACCWTSESMILPPRDVVVLSNQTRQKSPEKNLREDSLFLGQWPMIFFGLKKPNAPFFTSTCLIFCCLMLLGIPIFFMVFHGLPGLVNIQKAIEHGHWNSGFYHKKWWFSIVMLVYQRVYSKELLLCPILPTLVQYSTASTCWRGGHTPSMLFASAWGVVIWLLNPWH